MKKAIIGIISSNEYVLKGNYKKKVISVNNDYIDLIINNGGIPLIIPNNINDKDLDIVSRNIDGLLLIGGEDVGKKLYRSNSSEISNRDILEAKIYKLMKNNNKPILGICRGMQIINVLEGGSLTNINESNIRHFIEEDGWINYHPIRIIEGTRLANIIRRDNYTVSSVHHQRINRLGKEVIVNATSEDGVIEGIEVSGKTFIMGLQGHIEKCLDNFKEYKDIVGIFIKEAINEKR